MNTRLLFLLTLILCIPFFSFSQKSTQNIRGTVRDAASDMPLPYVSVVLTNGGSPKGITTDSVGDFIFTDVPVGRYDIEVSFMGYDAAFLREVLVTSAKEVVLNVSLKENLTQLTAAVVKSKVNKAQPINKMAVASARMLSTEEASRYAGGFDDPARLASAFAGVASNVGDNGIVVRGNAPRSLQWRLEGVEIPNPNHFADVAVMGGGGLTALSSFALGNSDFFTGAFPAEYGNALSGVFDINLRTGNNQQMENTVQLGVVGIDVASEGPFKKGGESSYMFNYRYSTFALLAPILPDGAENLRYQDLSFKLNFPTQKAGTFSLWGMGLIDGQKNNIEEDVSEWEYLNDKVETELKQYMGAVGLSHRISLSNNAFMKTTLAATVSRLDATIDEADSTLTMLPKSCVKNTNWNFVLSSYVNKRFGAHHTNRTGIVLTGLKYNMFLQDNNDVFGAPLQTINNEDGFSALLSAYTNSSFNFADKWTLNAGVHGQFFTLNNQFSIEPRVGLKYALASNQSLGLSYGLHSRLEALMYYFARSANGQHLNKDMGFTRAHHLVLSYDWNISRDFHLRVEPYVQQLYNVPVVADSSYALINLQNDWFVQDKFENTGKGLNYGIDVTFEKFMSRGYYFMFTASVYNSRYKGGDGVWRNTRFNRNFLFNFLIGKEWMVGRSKQNMFSANFRLSYQGGDRYSPVDEQASVAKQSIVYNEYDAFSKQAPAMFLGHFTVSYKINRKKVAHEFALKILNATNSKEFYGYDFNYKTQKSEMTREPIMIPNISYKLEF